jgi:hypothetical protein
VTGRYRITGRVHRPVGYLTPVTPSPTIRPSVYISMVHHDDIYVFFLSIGYLCVGMYYVGVCVYVCVHMEVSHIFFI